MSKSTATISVDYCPGIFFNTTLEDGVILVESYTIYRIFARLFLAGVKPARGTLIASGKKIFYFGIVA
jgi:hypothetical protein